MEKIQIAITAIAALIGTSAFAADMALKAAPPAPPPVPTWTGFYAGFDAGWAQGDQNASTNATPSPGFGAPAIDGAGLAGIGLLPTSHDLDGGGALGGVHAGYNWQTANWVFGVEGDFMFVDRDVNNTQSLNATFTPLTVPNAGTMTVSADNNWLASARGRLGWAMGSWMPYATGGAAWTKTFYTANYAPANLAPAPSPTSVSFSDTKTGWVAGGGFEWRYAPQWVIRAEYLYYGFDGSSAILPFGPAGSCTAGHCNWNVNTGTLQFQVVRAGVSYKFF